MSGILHLAAAGFAGAGLIWLICRSGSYNPIFRLLPALVFGISMIFLFLASSLYHLLPLSEKGVRRLRKLDHSSIYVFIAGSYTPVCLMVLHDKKGLIIAAILWAIALVGVLVKIFWVERSRWVRIVPYLAMGWISVLILPDLWQRLPTGALVWLGAGGFAYSFGALVYALKWPDPLPNLFGFHEVWHLFVIGGCFCHFWMVKQYLLVE